jgi:hypothetical protein
MNRESAPEIMYYGVGPTKSFSNSCKQPYGCLGRKGAREYGVMRPRQEGFPVPSQRAGQRLPHRHHPAVTFRRLHPVPTHSEGPLSEPHILPGQPGSELIITARAPGRAFQPNGR